MPGLKDWQVSGWELKIVYIRIQALNIGSGSGRQEARDSHADVMFDMARLTLPVIPTDYYVAPYGNKLIWFTPEGELDVLEPTSVSDEVLEEDGVLDEVDMRFRNRIYAATHGGGQQKQPSQRGRLKMATQNVIVEQVAAIGELPETIPRDGAARATLQRDVEREVFDSALEGAGLSVPSLSPETADEIATLEEPSQIGRRRRRAAEGAWFRSQQSNGSV